VVGKDRDRLEALTAAKRAQLTNCTIVAVQSFSFHAGLRLFRLPHASADIALFNYLLLHDLPHLFERCALFRRREQLLVRSLY
jgi:hypothetical protein